MDDEKLAAIAKRTVDKLFTAGNGQQAMRLEMQYVSRYAETENLGGWGLSSVQQIILEALQEAAEVEPSRPSEDDMMSRPPSCTGCEDLEKRLMRAEDKIYWLFKQLKKTE